jgi:Fur family transcriptional regulator, ferric uptake regulator
MTNIINQNIAYAKICVKILFEWRKFMRTSSVDAVILEILSKEKTHLTSNQVHEKIRGQFPTINFSTVYRALERLTRQGHISVSDMGTGAVVYESREGEMHHHLVCQKCGRVLTIGNEDVYGFFTTLQDKNHFTIATNHLILFGTCENCSKINGN